MLTREDVIEKLKNGELTPQDIAANGWMCSVTQRISKIKQPRGGYIKPKEFEQIALDGGSIDDLHPEEKRISGLGRHRRGLSHAFHVRDFGRRGV